MTRFAAPPSERKTSRPSSSRHSVFPESSVKSAKPHDHRRPTGTILDRTDVKELSPEVEAARAEIQRRRLQEKEQEARLLAQRNREYKARINSAGQRGRDAKELTPEQEATRADAEKRRLADKARREAHLAKENKEKLRKLRQAGAQGRDVKELSPEEEALRQAVKERSRQDKQNYQRALAKDNKQRMEKLRVAGSKGRDEKALTPEQEAARVEAQRRRLEEKRKNKLALAVRNRDLHERLFPDEAELEPGSSTIPNYLDDNSFMSSDYGTSAEASFISQDHSLQQLACQISDIHLDAAEAQKVELDQVLPALNRLAKFQEAGYDYGKQGTTLGGGKASEHQAVNMYVHES